MKGSIKKKSKLDTTADFKAPTVMHEKVLTTIRREKDTLELALHNEKNARRILEDENEEMRKRLREYESDVKSAYQIKQMLQ